MRNTVRPIERGLVTLLILTPLLFGTVEFWSLAFMELFTLFLLLLFFCRVFSPNGPPVGLIRPPLLVPIAILLGITVIQMVPVPPELFSILSPATYGIYRETFPYEGGLPWLTLSLYPHASILEAVRFLTCIGVYFLTVQVIRDRDSATRMAGVLLAVGTGIALLGIFQAIFWNGKLLWFRELSQGGAPFGPYVNRNHFAGLMEMVIPVSAGLVLSVLPGFGNRYGLKATAADFFTHRKINISLLSGAATVIMVTALFLSLSRGGIIGLSLSMVLFGFMLALRNSTRKKGRLILLLFLAVLLSVSWFGWNRVAERFGKIRHADVSAEYRIHNWRDSLKIIAAFPVFGSGLGTYEEIYPRFKTVPAQERWEHAHNDYIEAAVEMGVPGLVAALCGLVSFYVLMGKILMRRKSLHSRLFGIAGMAGITGIVIHSVTDFNLHVGANGFYFAFLMGFTVAVSHAKSGEAAEGTLLRVTGTDWSPGKRAALRAAVVAACLLVSAVPLLDVGSELYYAAAGGSLNARQELASRRSMLAKAKRLGPLNARLSFAAGNVDYALGKTRDAAENYARAVALNPACGEYLQMLGIALGNIGNSENAERFMQLAVLYDPTSAWIRKNRALWLFSRGEREAGVKEMREAIALDPSRTRSYLTSLVLSGVAPSGLDNAIPEDATALVQYGRFREERGDIEGALQSFLDALRITKNKGEIRPEIYHRIAEICERQGMLAQAMGYYEEGVRVGPSDHGLRFGLAQLYDRMGIFYRAKEEYEHVLVLNPMNEYAQKRVKELAGR